MKNYLIPLLGIICLCNFIPLSANAQNNTDEQNISRILAIASHCANAHNTQMWSVKMDAYNKISLYIDKSRSLPEIDPNNRESLISIGAFIQNIIYVAEIYNFDSDVTIYNQEDLDKKLAEIELRKKEVKTKPRFSKKELLQRHTDKGSFSLDSINENTLTELINEAPLNVKFYPVDSTVGNQIKKNLIEANTKQAYNDKKQAELQKWMRISWGENISSQDGITPKMLGLPLPARLITYTFFNKKIVMNKSFRESGIKKAKKQANNCAGFLVITTESSSSKNILKSGETLETIWILANKKGLAIQPMSQIQEEEPYRDEMNKILELNKPISMILRIGYPIKKTSPSSKRRATNKFLRTI